jgi:glucose-6-phosphate 1-dehydrogenase
MSSPDSPSTPRDADAVVLFGASGDLAKRKLFPALYELHRAGRLDVPIVGVGRTDLDDDELRDHARGGIERFARTGFDEEAFASFSALIEYVRGDYGEEETFVEIAERLGERRAPVAYLAVPPSVFARVVHGLADHGFAEHGRVVVEKPFGRDLASARELNEELLATFPEDQVLRIDHYLGKEELLDLLVLRFANRMFEPLWNREHIASVQITMAEDLGLEGRAGFYEEVGALRDVVQNHLLQIVALVAMEPPVDAEARSLRDEKVKVLRSMRALQPEDVVRGQFTGYRDEDGVAEDSDTETFVAMRCHLDTWRWAGVPFYIRAGKGMAMTATEVLVEFRDPPTRLFAPANGTGTHPNHLVLRMKPGERWTLGVQIKQPGTALETRGVELAYAYDERVEGPREEAYERLLGDAVAGDPRLFARGDAIEEQWRVVDPVLADPTPVELYERGTMGPEAADALIEGDGGWHCPDVS